ncbi:conserved hypothetical protein [Candida dubliniensis CD36]|uniref:Uncharacterized protein n=1 Tax=Candida dubliniensis (strain CD36 / ATCC MYA-646 / CBS 7987 / NCPF 3949 / NRRL Y-17841) TaxID=573826 RepID=B9WDE2_CANDC|nr:conserved hypothetical protein [Candida dubliniensis CD36]CAX42694.1 conserved hypothetical protein [Candida dubliniensis CD36]
MNTGVENDFKYLHNRNLQQLPSDTKNPSQNIPYNYLSSDEDIEDEYYSDDESQNQLDHEINQLINQQNERQFKHKFKQMENQSLQRFKSQWDAIIDKYSKIDDSTQSDEIDIVTGELITNNGHLDKLNQNHNHNGDITKMDIWRQDYGQQWENWRQRDFRMKRVAKQRKNEQRQILKKLDLFNKPIYGYSKFEKLEENDFFKQSPTKSKVPSGIESDESPTKKRRVFTEKNAISKNSSDSEFLEEEEEEEEEEEDDDGGIENESAYHKTVIAHQKLSKKESDKVLHVPSGDNFSPCIDERSFRSESNESQSEDSQDYESNLSPDISDDDAYQSIIINDKKYIPKFKEHFDESETESISKTPNPQLSSEETPGSSSQTEEISPSPHPESTFDDEYSIIEEPYYFLNSKSTPLPTIFNCAFIKCHYCTGNKKLYESHLLQSHNSVLAEMGYPINLNSQNIANTDSDNENVNTEFAKRIIDVDLNRLYQVFPKTYELPPQKEALTCSKKLANGQTCQKFYLVQEQLDQHREVGDECTDKRQVLFCPILGCGYLTDGGYKEWREHMITTGHSQEEIEVKENLEKLVSRPIATRKVSVKIPKFTETDFKVSFIDQGYESIDELFN